MTPKARRSIVVLLVLAGLLPGGQSHEATSSTLVISAVFFDPYLSDEPDEAVEITNVSTSAIDLVGWQWTDNEETVTFPSHSLGPGERMWVTKTATSFTEAFGFAPAFEYGGESDSAVPNLSGGAPTLANDGGEVLLLSPSGETIDAVVYGSGDLQQVGWTGEAVQAYAGGSFGVEGQILYRKLDQVAGAPVPDTDTATDWAQATDDAINGKKVRYPGWSLHTFFRPATATESGDLRIFVAPDHVFEEVRAVIDGAMRSLDLEGYALTNADLVDAIVVRQGLGVTVRVLLEGAPVTGVSDQQRWVAQQIEQAGGQVYFMHTDEDAGIHGRYTFQHAKFLIVDGTTVLVGSENLDYTGMPADDKSDGTSGNRGASVLTTAPSIVDHFEAIFADDVDPDNHNDLFRWTASHETYGAPPEDFQPSRDSGGSVYQVLKQAPFQSTASVPIEVVQCPENCLRDSGALIGLVNRAGPGDTLLVEQLYEWRYWGALTSNSTDDPNPRLAAYIAAARRGALVQILLDSQFDDPLDPRSNTATAGYVNGLASTEGLYLEVRSGNPTGAGIHNTMVLAQISGVGVVHIGSINGSETSSKTNREVAVQIESTDAYFYLEEVFTSDWSTAVETRSDTTAPATPTGVTAAMSSTANAIDVNWTDSAEPDLSHYRLYVGGAGGPYQFAGATTQSAFTHAGLTVGQTYAYVLTAVDMAGNESANSNEATLDLSDDNDTDFSLTYLETWEMEVGTHRPEIFLTDSGDLLLMVVEHEDQGEIKITHKGYRFDSDFNSLIEPFVVTTETEEYGHPADHRAALIDGQVVVVYQTLIIDPDASGEGTPETNALSQSLMLARFDAETGEELDRQPLAPGVTDFSLDNFPDHCLLWWEGRLLVSTGSLSEGSVSDHFRIREIDPFVSYPDNVLAVHDLTLSDEGLPSNIGNSFMEADDGSLWMFGSTGPNTTAQLQAAPLGEDFEPQAGIAFYDEEIEQTFPTGVIVSDDMVFVGSIYRPRGGEISLDLNPYRPRLKVLSADLKTVLYDEAVGDGSPGSAHIHPTIAIAEDRLYLAWSRQGSTEPAAPQVMVEVYSVQR